MSNKMKVELILQYMKQHKLSKKSFCKLCDIGYSSLNNVLKGNLKISYIVYVKIVNVMGIKLKDLIGD